MGSWAMERQDSDSHDSVQDHLRLVRAGGSECIALGAEGHGSLPAPARVALVLVPAGKQLQRERGPSAPAAPRLYRGHQLPRPPGSTAAIGSCGPPALLRPSAPTASWLYRGHRLPQPPSSTAAIGSQGPSAATTPRAPLPASSSHGPACSARGLL